MERRLEYLQVSAEQRYIFNAFTEVTKEGSHVPRAPQTYVEVRDRANRMAEIMNGAKVPEGARKRLPFDAIFRAAINSHAIRHVQGGYVITDEGMRQREQAGLRLDAMR